VSILEGVGEDLWPPISSALSPNGEFKSVQLDDNPLRALSPNWEFKSGQPDDNPDRKV